MTSKRQRENIWAARITGTVVTGTRLQVYVRPDEIKAITVITATQPGN